VFSTSLFTKEVGFSWERAPWNYKFVPLKLLRVTGLFYWVFNMSLFAKEVGFFLWRGLVGLRSCSKLSCVINIFLLWKRLLNAFRLFVSVSRVCAIRLFLQKNRSWRLSPADPTPTTPPFLCPFPFTFALLRLSWPLDKLDTCPGRVDARRCRCRHCLWTSCAPVKFGRIIISPFNFLVCPIVSEL